MSLGFVGRMAAAVQVAPELFLGRLLHLCRSSEVTTYVLIAYPVEQRLVALRDCHMRISA
jgi:hypothetical protein